MYLVLSSKVVYSAFLEWEERRQWGYWQERQSFPAKPPRCFGIKKTKTLINFKKSVLENVYILPGFASYTIKHIKIILEKNSSNFRVFPEVLFRATEAVASINRSLLNIKGLLV